MAIRLTIMRYHFSLFISENFHVFVGDLATEVDNCTLKAAFESFGEISSVFRPSYNLLLYTLAVSFSSYQRLLSLIPEFSEHLSSLIVK